MLSISLGDILKALEKFKAWPRIQACPDRVDALEQRVQKLEAELAKRPKTEACQYCHSELRLISEAPDPVFGSTGLVNRTYQCSGCDRTIVRPHDLMKG